MSESDFQDILHHLYRNSEKQVTESILNLTSQSKSSLHPLDFGQFPALQNTVPQRVSVHPAGSDVVNVTNNYFSFPPELHIITTVLEKLGSTSISSLSLMDSDTSNEGPEPQCAAPTSNPEPVRDLRAGNFNIQTAIADMFKARGRTGGPVLNNAFPGLPRDPFARPCDVEAATQQFFCSEWLYGESPGVHPYDSTTSVDEENSRSSRSRATSRSARTARSRPNSTDQQEIVIHDDPLDLSDSNPYAECTYGQPRTYRSRALSSRDKSRCRKSKLRSKTRTKSGRKRIKKAEVDEDDELDELDADSALDDDDEEAEDDGGECVIGKPSMPSCYRNQRKMPTPRLRPKKMLSCIRHKTRSRSLLKRRRTRTKVPHRSRSRIQQ